MVGIEEYRARIGGFRCRGNKDLVQDDTDSLSEWLCQLQKDLRHGKDMDVDTAKLVMELNQLGDIADTDPLVIEAKRVIRGENFQIKC